MAAGLEVFDANGNVSLSLVDRITRHIGTVQATASGAITVPEFSQGTPWWHVYAGRFTVASQVVPTVTISGTTLSWVYGVGVPLPVSIAYGVY